MYYECVCVTATDVKLVKASSLVRVFTAWNVTTSTSVSAVSMPAVLHAGPWSHCAFLWDCFAVGQASNLLKAMPITTKGSVLLDTGRSLVWKTWKCRGI